MKAQELFPILLDADGINRLPAKRLPAMDSTPSKLLWRSGDSVAGILYVPAAGSVTMHRHRYADHHAWVLEGSCTMLGRTLGPGSYAHIPRGVDHDVIAAGPDGAAIYYVFMDEGPCPR